MLSDKLRLGITATNVESLLHDRRDVGWIHQWGGDKAWWLMIRLARTGRL